MNMAPYLWLTLIVIGVIIEASTVSLVSIWFVAGFLAALIVSFFGVQLWIQTMGRGAGQKVNFIRVRGGDQQVRFFDPCLQQGVHAGAVAGDRHDIILLLRLLQHMGIGVNQRNVMILGRQ